MVDKSGMVSGTFNEMMEQAMDDDRPRADRENPFDAAAESVKYLPPLGRSKHDKQGRRQSDRLNVRRGRHRAATKARKRQR